MHGLMASEPRMMVAALIPTAEVEMKRLPSGEIGVRVQRLRMNGRTYTKAQFISWYTNEIMRKGTPPHMRTTSRRFRAGSRRTKRYARDSR